MRSPSIQSDQVTSTHISTLSGYELERAPSPIALRACHEPLLKRPLDIVLSSAMLLLSAPVWLIIALAIKIEDGGPIFYRQRRWGWCGTIITRPQAGDAARPAYHICWEVSARVWSGRASAIVEYLEGRDELRRAAGAGCWRACQ
jgi:hypothetical protein